MFVNKYNLAPVHHKTHTPHTIIFARITERKETGKILLFKSNKDFIQSKALRMLINDFKICIRYFLRRSLIVFVALVEKFV